MSNPLTDLGLSLEDLLAIARLRGIEDYESIAIDELSNIILPSKKEKKNQKKVKNQKQVFLKQE